MKETIMIISFQNQFGYHTDLNNYCKYLKDKFNIIFLSVDEGLEKLTIDNVENIYISNKFKKIKLIYEFYKNIKKINKDRTPKYIFVKYFKGCSLIPATGINLKGCILDIRTGSVYQDNIKRRIENLIIKIESKFFINITVISKEIADLLGLKKAKEIPLGGKVFNGISLNEKLDYKRLDLIYVGTLSGRKIEDTVEAFNVLSNKYKGKSLSYTIITNSESEDEKNKIMKLINENKYNNIRFIGRIQNEKLGEYLKECNVGISYIPITDYYTYQPPTKTYEYLFNGLFTIATNTIANKKIINSYNGILIDDSVESFTNNLDDLYCNKERLNIKRSEIHNTVKENSWENICNDLYNYIISI